ncbi:MAG TPA: hypothetical protein VN039_01090 [Nitrospira sp.]|nr:hypothetical protein [Nitrospira sp.]
MSPRSNMPGRGIVYDSKWAEINQEKDVLQVEFYPRPDGQPWLISFVDAVAALDDAKKRLLG